MLNDYGMYQGYSVEGAKEMEQPATIGMMGDQCCCQAPTAPACGMVLPPVYECGKERQIHRNIIHEVPHICPVNTRIINHHIYKHTYSPCYTCCEENVVCNVHEGSCCNF